MPFVKLVVMIAALGSAAAGVALVASGVQAAALIILSAAIVATVLSDERGRSRRS